MKIGYARVSTHEQDAQLQIDALNAAGCERIYEEKQSGAQQDRHELQQCLKSLKAGDILTVWKLDRLGCSLQYLIELVTDFESRQIGFQSLTENIDTTSSTGKLIFHIFGSLAEFERGLARERIKAGLAAAKKKGTKFGRPEALNKKDKEMALAMFNGGATKIYIARHFNVTRQTIYTLLKDCGI
jgi:DNA invertase Pin-like site-specific DNA recombinase